MPAPLLGQASKSRGEVVWDPPLFPCVVLSSFWASFHPGASLVTVCRENPCFCSPVPILVFASHGEAGGAGGGSRFSGRKIQENREF